MQKEADNKNIKAAEQAANTAAKAAKELKEEELGDVSGGCLSRGLIESGYGLQKSKKK